MTPVDWTTFFWAMILWFWLCVGVGYWLKLRKEERENAKADREYIESHLGNDIFSNFYCVVNCLDVAVDKATVPASEFVAYCECPECGLFELHYIYKYTRRHVVRQCADVKCEKKWKQIR